MAVLAIDTSAAVSVALLDDDGGLLAARQVVEQRRHAELLTPMIDEVLAEAGLTPADLRSVVVGTGPAPFTGLRVGLVTAEVLGFALGIPVHGVSSLDAVASAAALRLALPAGSSVLVVTDARRREVYFARYTVGAPLAPRGAAGDRVSAGSVALELAAGPGVAAPADVVEQGHAAGAVVVGPGTSLYPDVLPARDAAPDLPDPAHLARLALAGVAAGRTLPTEPLYLRRPDAQEPAARKRATG